LGGEYSIKEIKRCEICGAQRKQNSYHMKSRKFLCQKHKNQYSKYGRFLDSNPVTKFDKNNVILYDDYAEIEIRDKNGDIIARSKIDLEDIDKCKDSIWCLSEGYAISHNCNGEFNLLHRLIMCAPKEYHIDHISGDRLDNRKQNLRLCVPQENARNSRGNINMSACKIIGVRKDTRCNNSWRAQIYVDKDKKIEKTYKDKELAIIQRLIWELIYFKEFSPQIELIKEKYPYLLGIFNTKNMTFNPDISLIRSIGDKLKIDPHCPCLLTQSEATTCPCLPCRIKNNCHCGLFVVVTEENNPNNLLWYKTQKEKFNPNIEEFVDNYKKLKSSRKMAKHYDTNKSTILQFANKINYFNKKIEEGDII